MFEEWGFLLGEIWFLLLLAVLLGLLAGWIFWRRRSEVVIDTTDLDACRADLARCRDNHDAKDATIAALRAELDAVPAPVTIADLDLDGDGVIEGKDEGSKPVTLTGARDGKADDLKRIKGVGPKLEKMLNELGFYHFDQIAAWSGDEVAWVDANLEGFKGRVTRDTWIEQSSLLAAGGETAFSKKVDKGGVY